MRGREVSGASRHFPRHPAAGATARRKRSPTAQPGIRSVRGRGPLMVSRSLGGRSADTQKALLRRDTRCADVALCAFTFLSRGSFGTVSGSPNVLPFGRCGSGRPGGKVGRPIPRDSVRSLPPPGPAPDGGGELAAHLLAIRARAAFRYVIDCFPAWMESTQGWIAPREVFTLMAISTP